jgi:ABC-type Mn2+/Zn2+ transport system ATPase subunit
VFEGVELLKAVSWDVKKGERVGLVGWNGAGKTTQLKLITGELELDGGEILRAKPNMNIAFLSQEFEVVPTRTVREEFLSAFGDSLEVMARLEATQRELEAGVEDMERMGALLDSLASLQKKADRANVFALQAKVDKMMPTLGFEPDRDNERLVASFSGGWQMRLGLGKILLKEPDLLLLDEPTNRALPPRLCQLACLTLSTRPGRGGDRVVGGVPAHGGGAHGHRLPRSPVPGRAVHQSGGGGEGRSHRVQRQLQRLRAPEGDGGCARHRRLGEATARD